SGGSPGSGGPPRPAEDEARLAEITAHVRPADPVVACFADEAAYVAASPELQALARAVVLFDAMLGLPSQRVDMRRGEAARAARRQLPAPTLAPTAPAPAPASRRSLRRPRAAPRPRRCRCRPS